MTAGNRYVPTASIRDAVRGREIDVLTAVDIQWYGNLKLSAAPTLTG